MNSKSTINQMVIQYASELHLEFPQNAAYLRAHPLIPAGDVLLLAGDVVPFAAMEQYEAFFDNLADMFERVYWIPGNHEYYHADISERSGSFCEKIRENVFLLNNTTETIGNIRLICTTLWTHISPVNAMPIQRAMSDFRTIRYQGGRFNIDHCNQLHAACLAYLRKELTRPHRGPTIVMTHHVPTHLNYPPKFHGDPLNEAFAVELHDLIESSEVSYWFYGHHHQPVAPFTIGRTRLLTNQLGYVQFGEHRAFKRDAVVEVDGGNGEW